MFQFLLEITTQARSQGGARGALAPPTDSWGPLFEKKVLFSKKKSPQLFLMTFSFLEKRKIFRKNFLFKKKNVSKFFDDVFFLEKRNFV